VHGAYLVEYPEGGGVLIDAAFGEADMAGFLFEGRFDARAFEKVRATMLEVDRIVLTHEHFDHLGGLAHAPDAQAVSERLVMNPEQLASDEASQYLSDALRSKLEPVDYEETMRLAPGVVLLRAPGHTPGSQIVYVLLESGEEMLFIGDVAWALDQIRNEHYRPRLVTDIFLGEDRQGVMHQMLALKGVMAEGRATVVSSHDVENRRRLIEAGLIGEGFP
jgi:glyoxylase-like metal-dependent hydrolase (beta-lactamase superfamily II)